MTIAQPVQLKIADLEFDGVSASAVVARNIEILRCFVPNANVDSELVEASAQSVVVKVTLSLPGSETVTGVGAAALGASEGGVELAEDRALSQVLSSVPNYSVFVERPSGFGQSGQASDVPKLPIFDMNAQGEDRYHVPVTSINQPITARQRKFVLAIAEAKGIHSSELTGLLYREFARPFLEDLDRREAARLIALLQAWDAPAIAS
ncbi:hypothetical protein BH23CHL5_BH23CHL5_23100 [soil metagenome]